MMVSDIEATEMARVWDMKVGAGRVSTCRIRSLEPQGFMHYVRQSLEADVIHDLHECRHDPSSILMEEAEAERHTSEALSEGQRIGVALRRIIITLDTHEAHNGLVGEGADHLVGVVEHLLHQVPLVLAHPLKPDPQGHHMDAPDWVPPELNDKAGVEAAVYGVEGVDLLLGQRERDP